MKNNINTKLILFHPYIQKLKGPSVVYDFLIVYSSLLLFLFTLIYTREYSLPIKGTSTAVVTCTVNPPLPTTLVNMLLHYASRSNYSFNMMTHAELKRIADVLVRSPCNFHAFGLTQETLIWKALNHNDRTVFIDELHPEIDVFDVQYTTKMSETRELDQIHNISSF